MLPLVKQFADEEWVWGTGGGLSVASWPKLTAQVTDLYERDYNNAWDALLNDLEIVPFSTVEQYADALGILVGPTSPLRGMLKIVVDNTSLVAPPTARRRRLTPSISDQAHRRGEGPLQHGAEDDHGHAEQRRPARSSRSTSSRSTGSWPGRPRRSTPSWSRFARFGISCSSWVRRWEAPIR